MSHTRSFLDELRSTVLLGDGAMGTELLARGASPESGIERLNLLAPQLVLQLHRDYIAAGSRVIETNTFAANRPTLARHKAEKQLPDILASGVRLAREAAGADAYVAGSIGPLPPVDGVPLDLGVQAVLFQEQIDTLLNAGVDLLLFETFVNLTELSHAVMLARKVTDRPIIAQMAFEHKGHTPGGETAEEMARRCLAAGADVVGANCGEGIPSIATALRAMAGFGAPLSAYVNGGFAEQIEGRRVYVASAEYLVNRTIELLTAGATLIGGCCGTNPAFIKAVARRLEERQGVPVRPRATAIPTQTISTTPPVTIAEPPPVTVPRGILVELDPPKDLNLEPLLVAAQKLKNTGITALTLADNPLASVCMDGLTVAGIINRDSGLPLIPHLTGRDRNRIALQSTIMGAHALGLPAILCVTGDPVRMYHETNTSGVFDVTSVGLVRLISEFNRGQRAAGGMKTGFAIGVAVNPNVRSLGGQIDHLKRKIDAGAHFALTQPIFDKQRAQMFRSALDAAGITIPVFVGILPLTSARNAEFLHNEVPGITIPETVRQSLAQKSSLEDQRLVARDFAIDLVKDYSDCFQDFYLITPRNKAEYVTPLIAAIKK